jgi:hypothetical protein
MNKLNHNGSLLKNQLAQVESFIDKLMSAEELEKTAATQGALIRKRVIKSAKILIIALFTYATVRMSQRNLSASMAAIGLADMSDQAWQKKIVKCGKWLTLILSKAMSKYSITDKEQFHKREIKLIDGSMIVQEGTKGKKGGKSLRIHMCYSLTKGRMDSVQLTDEHTAESVTILPINSGDIILGDAGFGKGNAIEYVVSKRADAIFRATPNHMKLAKDEKGKDKIDMVSVLSKAKEDILDFGCHIHTKNGKYCQVRVIARRLPEDKAILAKQRKKQNAIRKQSKLKDETLIFAEWTILITTLGDEYNAMEILALYRIRWQIELLFKRFKQAFKVSKLPPASLEHSKVMVLLWLILWTLTERQSVAFEMFLADKNANMELYSIWAVQGFIICQIKALFNSVLSLISFDEDSLSTFAHRLFNHRSSRLNQYSLFRF